MHYIPEGMKKEENASFRRNKARLHRMQHWVSEMWSHFPPEEILRKYPYLTRSTHC